jgi:hypothetical protein
MANVNLPPKTIGEIMDDIERIREELLGVQNALEKMEAVCDRPKEALWVVTLSQKYPAYFAVIL